MSEQAVGISFLVKQRVVRSEQCSKINITLCGPFCRPDELKGRDYETI